MQLQVNLVAQDILAQSAADNRLHGMLGHHMELHTVGVFTAVVAIRTLLNLKEESGDIMRWFSRKLQLLQSKNVFKSRNEVSYLAQPASPCLPP